MPVTERKRAGFLRPLLAVLLCLCLALAGFVGGVWLSHRQQAAEAAEPVVTSELLNQYLRDVQELVTVEYHYTNVGKYENQLNFYGWKVPFTNKSFFVSYDGVILAGVDLSAARLTVNEAAKTVTITLPESRIISHEIDENSLQVFDETTNVFNPISIENYTDFISEEKTGSEHRAIEGGLLDDAGGKARTALESLLRDMPGMEEYIITVN